MVVVTGGFSRLLIPWLQDSSGGLLLSIFFTFNISFKTEEPEDDKKMLTE
jgi:hypothetical protein